MKKFFISFIMCLSAIALFAQNKNTTLYIYRNDGMFNAFYYSEVDSMLCSMIDTTGVEHTEYVVQEVYTADSLYRIPLSAIDSISFATPKAEYQKNVKLINTSWLDYIISVEDLTITISKDIPSELMPIVGQVIVAETKEHPFEMGFAGRVLEIKNNGENYLVLCSDVTLKEIYKTLVYKGRSKSSQNSAQARAKRAENRNEMETVYFDIPHNLSLSLGPLSLNVSPTIALDYIICINDEQTYIDNRITHYYDCSAQLDCELTGENELVDMPLSFPIPTEVPGLRAEINVGTFFGYSGGITISMNKPFTVTGTTGYIAYDDHAADIDEWHFESKDTEFSANINGSVRFGMAAQARLAFITDRLASIDVTGYFGPEVTANFSLSSNGLLDGSLYSALKDSKITLNAYGAVKPGWRFAGFEHQELNYNPSFHFELNQWYILPEFNNLSWTQTQGTKGGKLDGVINRDLFWPGVQLGWSLYDRDEHMYASQYYPETYRLMGEWPWRGLEMELNDLPYGSKYTAYPMIRIWGYEMRALPSTEVKINPLVSTGGASDIGETSAVTSGYVEGLEYSMVADAGICYSTGDPISGSHVSSGSRTDGGYSVPLSGLASNTTYFYAAYAYYDGEYYYGDTSSFKTKKNEDPTPIAITGEHKNEQTTSATIECTYKYVPNNADCGYYITKSYYENAARGNRISGGIEWNKVSVGRYEGTKEISLDNLMPDEEYQYYAYISVGNEDVATGTIKSFTTKTPKAQLIGEPLTNITSATVGYGFENVPEGGTCQLILLKVGDPLQNAQYISVPSTSNGNYTFADLDASTSYQYFARIEYKTRKWDSGTGSFTTQAMPTPVVITGGHYNETLNSATIECTYEQIPAGTDCGYYLRGQKGSTLISSISKSIGNVEGTKTINLSDLKAGTTYYYQAYAQYQGREYLGSENSFQTLTPNAVTGPYSNVTSNKASIVCGYFNVPEEAETGVLLSYDGEEHEMPYNYGEGEHNIDIDNLYPGTSYSYSAYIKYDDEIYQGETKQFITLTPSAYVGEATNVEEESVQFEYGFRNVPEGGTCHIALQQEGGETYDYSVSDAEQDIFQLSGLQPSTTYTYWSYVDYYGETWSSNSLQFTTKTPPTPVATTGDFSNVTMNSATVTCIYENVPEGGVCGVEYTWNGGSTKQTIGSSNGTQSITLSGLNPATSYTYCAYIEANGQTYYGSDKSFTTDSPSLAGTWNCTITKGTSTESWRITLTEDHKGSAVKTDGSSNAFEASWGVGADGKASVGFAYVISTSSYYSYQTYNLNGQVDNLMSPSQIQGEGWYEIGNAIAETVVPLTFNMSK